MKNKKYYSVAEFAERFSISRQTVYRLMDEGCIRFIRIRSLLRIPSSEVLRYEKTCNSLLE